MTLPGNAWTASSGIGAQGQVVIKGGAVLTYGPKGGTESNWFGGVGSESFFNLESNVQATLQGGADAADRSTKFSRIEASSSGETSVFVQGLRSSGKVNILTPSGNMIIDGVEFTIQKDEFGNNANLEVKNNGSLVINASYGINTGKTVTIQSGSTLAIAQSGIIREVTTNKVGGGTFDIKNGGIVKIGGVIKQANEASTYTGKVTNHTVKYNGTQVFKHP